MTAPRIAGFSIIRNATTLDFPLEASVGSVLPVVDEFVLAVGRSEDDTLDRARAMAAQHPTLRLIETEWDFSRGSLVLSEQTNLAMAACTADWGIYIQADEVLGDGAAPRLRDTILRAHPRRTIEGVVVDYLHFYGSFDLVGVSRRWYRREIRAVRLGGAVHSHRDAQGFRVGEEARRVRAVRAPATMYHYGWARPAWALRAKREQDLAIYSNRNRLDPERPLLPWMPGLRPFTGNHPALVSEWIAARRESGSWIAPRVHEREHLRVWFSLAVERLTGWRPFEFRNYTLHR